MLQPITGLNLNWKPFEPISGVNSDASLVPWNFMAHSSPALFYSHFTYIILPILYIVSNPRVFSEITFFFEQSSRSFRTPSDFLNHSENPNACYDYVESTEHFELTSRGAIKMNQEIFISYGQWKSDHILLAVSINLFHMITHTIIYKLFSC